ncbi:AMP-binding protein [Sneathiella chinensis]|uniref:Long-chain-fatty-acid--CoA ligase n=1 Tax=Sneathiella chinensis TaxID=349750 RepID=A0ABQ5U0Q9_9PROT|nr:AMP-binding protein [Sneathiella chinensis]GLQ04780.1 long-chain-fatty-acid--CoA ligase [Sneathiella chinensis]
MCEKVWYQHYGNDIPKTIDLDRYPSVVSMFDEAIGRFGDKTAFRNFGATLTYKQLDAEARKIAAYLQQVLGHQKGDRVAVMMPNIMAFPATLLGVLRAGLVQVNVNPLYTPRELEHQLNDAGVETIVIFSGSTGTLAEIVGNTGIRNILVADLGDLGNAALPSPVVDDRLTGAVPLSSVLEEGAKRDLAPVSLSHQDLVFLQYTGGTTGVAKGAMLSHGNLVANVLQFRTFVGGQVEDGGELVITALPLYHIFALTVNFIGYFLAGAENVMITNPRDMPAFVEELKKHKFTMMTGVNTLFAGLLMTPEFASCDFSRLRMAVGGGTAVQKAVSDRWKAVTGRHIQEGYGLSETSPIVTFSPPVSSEFKNSIGIPLPQTDVSIRGDDGTALPAGEVGEICVQGPQVMQGYWNRAEATAEVMTPDGYFRTGDVAYMSEDGYFHIVDRKKDMILVSGFNVFPNEIEAIVAELDGVAESACIGVEDERTGEAVKLFVVRAPGSEITAEEIAEYCRKNLTAYKNPKIITFIDELPKSTVGKILRRELRGL